MILEQTIEIPEYHRNYFDIPFQIPAGKAKIALTMKIEEQELRGVGLAILGIGLNYLLHTAERFLTLWCICDLSLKRDTGMHENNIQIVTKSVKAGISFGSCLAMIISYTAWKSIFWAIIHGLLSWVYVIYYFLNHYAR
jgi:hypothetical protein